MNSTEGTDSHITINKMLSGRTRLEIISTSVWCIIQRNIIEKEDFDKIRLHLVQPKMVLRKPPVGKFLPGNSKSNPTLTEIRLGIFGWEFTGWERPT